MKNITTLGIDLAKNVFQLHGVNKAENRLPIPASTSFYI